MKSLRMLRHYSPHLGLAECMANAVFSIVVDEDIRLLDSSVSRELLYKGREVD